MKGILIIIQLVIGMTTFLPSDRLEAQAVYGWKPNSFYRSFASDIAVAAKQQEQHQQGSVTIAGVPKADFSSLSNYNLYPVRRLRLIGGRDSVQGALEVGEASLLIVQPVPYEGSLYVFDVEKHSMNMLANTSRYEEAFQYGNASSLSFGYFLESEKYLAQIPIIADSTGPSLSFLEDGSAASAALPEFLQKRYGSIDGLRRRLQGEQEEKEAKEEAYKSFNPQKDAPDFIRKSWQIRSRYLPHDTAVNIQLLLNDISSALDMDANKLKPLFPLLEQHIRLSTPDTPSPGNDFNHMLLFMGKDIMGDLTHVLTADQAQRYLRHLAVWRWQFKAVDTYVYVLYLKGPYASIEEKNKAYDAYMLSFYGS
jgi:hypothetical protein